MRHGGSRSTTTWFLRSGWLRGSSRTGGTVLCSTCRGAMGIAGGVGAHRPEPRSLRCFRARRRRPTFPPGKAGASPIQLFQRDIEGRVETRELIAVFLRNRRRSICQMGNADESLSGLGVELQFEHIGRDLPKMGALRAKLHAEGLVRFPGVKPEGNPVYVVLCLVAVSYTHLRAHETRHDLLCRLLLEK